MRHLSILIALPLAACATPNSVDVTQPQIAALLALPAAQYAATHDIAEVVVEGCPDYRFNVALTQRLRALLRANGVRQAVASAVDIERDVIGRSFQAKHGITLGQGNTCTVIAAEVAEKSAMSTFFQQT